MNLDNPLTIRRLAMIKAVMAAGPKSCKAIAAETFVSWAYINRLMSDLRKPGPAQVVHIERWQRGERVSTALYVWGPGTNARRPRKIPNILSQRRYKERMRKDKERHEAHLAAQRAKAMAKRLSQQSAAKPVTWLSALGV